MNQLFRSALLVCTCVLSLGAPAAIALPKEVSVDLFEAKPPTRQIVIDGSCQMVQPENRRLPGQRFLVRVRPGGGVEILVAHHTGSDTAYGAPLARARRIVLRGTGGLTRLVYSDQVRRSYRGEIEVGAARGSNALRIVNRVPVRDYVTAVIGSETNPDFPQAELEAQCVLAQTMLSRYKPGDPLGDTTEREAYLGAEYERDSVRRAVEAAWQKILAINGAPIQVYFHSTCAGGTSDGASYFCLKPATSFPYLAARPCRYCRKSPFWKEKRSVIPKAVYNRTFSVSTPIVVEQDAQHRPLQIKREIAKSPGSTVAGFTYWTEIGQKLGWDKVPGTRFTIERDSASGNLTFRSTGAGHGVGMCQWGAAEMARQGKTCREILAFYFPGTAVQTSK